MTELGNRLKEARESKGMSLDDLQEATKIQKRYLTGIEEGRYEMMPGKFYVRAFIKQYCEAVGLDPEEIFEEYSSDVPAVSSQEYPDQLSRVQSRKTLAPANSKFMEYLPRILTIIVILAVIILAYVLISSYSSKDNAEKAENTQNEKVDYGEPENSPLKKDSSEKDSSKKEESKSSDDDQASKDENTEENTEDPEAEQSLESVTASGKNSTYELKNTDTFKIKLVSTGETWVDMKDSTGKSQFQGILKDKESKEIDFTGQKEASLKIGNASATEIYVNDQQLEYAVSPTDIVTQSITIKFTQPE